MHVSTAVSKTVTLVVVTSTSGASERVIVRTTGIKLYLITVDVQTIERTYDFV